MFSQTAEYAFRAMTYLASADGPAGSERIAAEVKVPKPYLLKILRDLVSAGLLESQRGPNGGFALVRRPETFPCSKCSTLSIGSTASRSARSATLPT
ncbi:MAG: Rrf2 family transcriptional regulator [Tepidisphaeraceae bacterium]